MKNKIWNKSEIAKKITSPEVRLIIVFAKYSCAIQQIIMLYPSLCRIWNKYKKTITSIVHWKLSSKQKEYSTLLLHSRFTRFHVIFLIMTLIVKESLIHDFFSALRKGNFPWLIMWIDINNVRKLLIKVGGMNRWIMNVN